MRAAVPRWRGVATTSTARRELRRGKDTDPCLTAESHFGEARVGCRIIGIEMKHMFAVLFRNRQR